MARIRCLYPDCIFLDEGYCTAAIIQVDPNQGCLTYKPEDEDDLPLDEELWEDELEGDSDDISWEAELEDALDDEDDWEN